MHIISYNCIVHSRTSFEQFKKAIDEIRQKQTIPISVLLKLEKQCCTCGQQERVPVDINSLAEYVNTLTIIHKNKLPKQRREPDDYLFFRLPRGDTVTQRQIRVGRFVGVRGNRLKLIENQFNIRIAIVNEKSEKFLQTYVNQLKEKNPIRFNGDILWILLTSVNRTNDYKKSIDRAKSTLWNAWKSIDFPRITHQREYYNNYGRVRSDAFEGDSRWRPITYRNRK